MPQKISVLFPVYIKDKPPWVRMSLESLLNQTLLPHEIVVIYDGPVTREVDNVVISTSQNALPVIFNIIKIPNNIGLGNALNIGIKNAQNELLARMDADDVAEPDRFRIQAVRISARQDNAILGGQTIEYDEQMSTVISKRIVPLGSESIRKTLSIINPMNHMTIVYKKSVVLSVGGYTEVKFYEDYLLWHKISQAGWALDNVPEVLVRVRAGENMINRRRGLKVFSGELKFQRALHNKKYITNQIFVRNIFIRAIPRLFPKPIFPFIYRKSRRYLLSEEPR